MPVKSSARERSPRGEFRALPRRPSWPKFLLFFGGLCLFAAAAACQSSKKGLTIKPDFSVNLATPQVKWPGDPEKTLSLGQQEVLRTRGKPDMIRIWWKGEEDFAQRGNLPMKVTPELLASVPESWVYLRPGDEIIFDGPVEWRSKAIGDKLAAVIKEGDPEEVKYVQSAKSAGEQEIWHYYSTGMTYTFREGKLIEQPRRQHPGISWLK